MKPKLGRFSIIRFRVSETYSEREIEDLFETLVERGATYERLTCSDRRGWHELSVPAEFLWEPYLQALEACESISEVSSFITKRQMIPVVVED